MKNSLQIKHIVLAYDASDEADHAFEYARALAQRWGAELDVLSVIARPAIGDDVELTAIMEEGALQAERGLRRLRHVLQSESLPVQFLTKVGRPAYEILNYAQDVGADLIVMGHRHRSLLERGLARSTVARVMEYAECPVLVVP
jgi:nucleotide-binding universal stress UspA family protein